jgi:GT2 family glycosyltransferase
VSSGEPIFELINEYSNALIIKHLHTALVGQSNQKNLAFGLLDKDTSWVFFLDDDLEVMPNTFKNVIRRINLIQNENINGIGTHIISKASNFQLSQKIRFQSSRPLGIIKASGRASKYAFEKIAYTEWLNGTSIWRKECLDQYMLPVLNSKYAAYEDVIFSTNVSKKSNLVYDPEIKVLEQQSHSNRKFSLSQFKYICLWTGYLVCSHRNTNILSYKLLTVSRMLKFLAFGGILVIIKPRNLKIFLKFSGRIIFLPLDKSKTKKIIVYLLELESNSK